MTFLDCLTETSLEIPPSVQDAAWQRLRGQASWSAYLNQVCLQTVLPWIQTEYVPDAESGLPGSQLASAWQLVNGTAIVWNNCRSVLVPSRSIDTSELRVPQEWMDIPSWVGDYYFAVQINPDDGTLRIWGYTTHEQIKRLGTYDADDRTYSLDAAYLIRDIGVFWVTQQAELNEVTRSTVAPLNPISATQAEALLQQLAHPLVIEPRSVLPFAQWGALVEQADWRDRLVRLQRQEQSSIVNLSRWLQQSFETSWQSLESLFDHNSALDYSFRQVADSAQTSVQRVKIVDLDRRSLLLIVQIDPDSSDRLTIRIQLRSADPQSTLPSGVRLTLRSSSDEIIQTITATDQDNLIQLKRFKCPIATRFVVELTIADETIIEPFVV